MESATDSSRSRRWQIGMVIAIFFGIVIRLVMLVCPMLEQVYSYFLTVPYAAFAALVLYDTDILRQTGFRLMLLCLFWAIFSAFFHKYDFNGITKLVPYLLMMLFAFTMCYPTAFLLPPEKAARFYRTFALVFVLCVTVLAVIGIYTAIARVTISNSRNILSFLCGVADGRLVLFAYPTVAAVFCGLALLLAVHLFFCYQKRLVRMLLVLVFIAIYIAMALTAGRISIACLCVCMGGVGYMIAENRLPVQKTLSRILVSLCVAAVTLAVGYLGTRLAVKAVNGISNAIVPSSVSVSIRTLSAPAAPDNVITVKDVLPDEQTEVTPPAPAESPESESDNEEAASKEAESRSIFENISTLQGRTYAWQGALNALYAEPVLLLVGSSPVYVMDRVDPYVPANNEPVAFFHLHSILFQTLVSFGLPGFLLFSALIIYILYHAVRVFFCGKHFCTNAERTLPLILVFCLGVDLLEIFLTFSDVTKMSNPIFFLTAGYVVYLSETRLPGNRKLRHAEPGEEG